MLEPKKRQEDGNFGKLPAMAPLANPYVPFQLENQPKYDPRRAMIRGTLYPGLDLPFMGMVNQTEKPINPSTDLQALGFAVQELVLYLDTHPQDTEALELYRSYQKLLHKAVMTYTDDCGPLNHMSPANDKSYSWLDDPWPWEFAGNKEG